MAKHSQDSHTLELPGLPAIAQRGRPTVGERAMTPAERKRRSRSMARQRAAANYQERLPVDFSCTVDADTKARLAQFAVANDLDLGRALDRLMELLADAGVVGKTA
ncbi:hypothetical protein [Chitinolyticbacter albus]|uniref:hypothetical protein n=1 Tax=Chitinolyticbacter albus TaxID=2961951 RepID=UPI00210A2B56|nr:hypothetical protein [Chitinolyticbacter albus]